MYNVYLFCVTVGPLCDRAQPMNWYLTYGQSYSRGSGKQ